MSIFEAAKMLGVLPSGVILGLVMGVVWGLGAPLRIWAVTRFISDMLYVMTLGAAIFIFSVGMAGELRYHTTAAVLIGLWCERMTLGKVNIINKSLRRIKRFFVVNAEISEQ